jgi:SagB-type dehydrogenase family enzyme
MNSSTRYPWACDRGQSAEEVIDASASGGRASESSASDSRGMATDAAYGGLPGSEALELWSLREDVSIETVSLEAGSLEAGSGLIRLRYRWGMITIQRAAPVVAEALSRMSLGPVSLRNVAVTANEDGARLLYQALDGLQPLVVRSLASESGQTLLSVVPMVPSSRFRPVPLPARLPVRLSRFVQMRTDGNEYRLESPLARHRVLLHRPQALWLIASLGRATTLAECTSAFPGQAPAFAAALSYLLAAGMVVSPDDERSPDTPAFAEDGDAALVGWSPRDLMVHTRSNLGRHDEDVGATFPMERSPEPVVKPPSGGATIPLYRPEWTELLANDPPLTVAIEARRSLRDYPRAPLTAAELGELLYRAARVRSVSNPSSSGRDVVATEPPNGVGAERSDRPYPSGGACHELELYVTAGQCEGLDHGVYHYDPLNHALELVNPDREVVRNLLRSASMMADMDTQPPLLITMTARIDRISWKYEGLVYSLILKHVGVLTQNLYLVSAAMRLGSCALGSVNLDATARAFGVDWRVEPSVGQFIVGGVPVSQVGRVTGRQPANDAWWADAAADWLGQADERGMT